MFEAKRNRLEALVESTKTSKKLGDRLPIKLIGPRFLVTGEDWFGAYDHLRTAAGIPFPAYPLFPAKRSGRWVQEAARVQDFNQGIKLVTASLGFPLANSSSSHGMKATLLAWACEFGMREDLRAALGYHRGKGKDSTVKVYSRDRLVAPLKELDDMLALIRDGDFNPDGEVDKPIRLSESKGVEDGELSLSESDSSGSDLEDDEKSSRKIELMCKRVRIPESAETREGMYVHRLGKIHQSMGPGFLKCGRKINENYT
eukprot:10510219-Karenia_brevis.AAC.1